MPDYTYGCVRAEVDTSAKKRSLKKRKSNVVYMVCVRAQSVRERNRRGKTSVRCTIALNCFERNAHARATDRVHSDVLKSVFNYCSCRYHPITESERSNTKY